MSRQVLIRTDVEGGGRVEVIDNPLNLPPISFENADRSARIPRLGSQDLLRLASFAVKHGWQVDQLEIADANLDPLPEEDEREISEELVQTLVGSGAERAVDAVLKSHLSVTVLGVHFIRSDNRGLVVRRNGVTDADPGVSPIDLVEPAWAALRLA